MTDSSAYNIADGIKEAFPADYSDLVQQLKAKGITIGNEVGRGSIAIVYEIKGRDGQVVPDAVLRIETNESYGQLESPAVIPVIDVTENNTFAALIVPRAVPYDNIEREDILKFIGVLNAGGHRHYISDIHKNFKSQFMRLGDMDFPVLVDLNAVSRTPDDAKPMGALDDSHEVLGLTLDQMRNERASAVQMARYQQLQSQIIKRTRQSLNEAGIKIDMPERQTAR